MSRANTGNLTTTDLLSQPYAGRPTCAHNHPWTPETTRWRRRGHRGKHTAAIERDCLTCKRASEKKRRARSQPDRRSPDV